MRTGSVNLIPLALGVLAALLLVPLPPSRGQDPTKPKPPANPAAAKEKGAAPADKPSLEDLLTQALKNNPDIRVAEARVQKAEAELNRTRLEVMQKVVKFHAARTAAQARVTEAEKQLQRVRNLLASSAISQQDYQAAQQALITAKAELEAVEADMPALIGKAPQVVQKENVDQFDRTVQRALQFLRRAEVGQDSRTATALFMKALSEAGRPGLAALSVPVSVGEKVRKALDKPIKVDFQESPLSDVLDYLQDQAGITIRYPLLKRYQGANPNVSLKFREPQPLRAVLQALEDELHSYPSGTSANSSVYFVVRDYGLLVVPRDDIPPGAVLVDELSSNHRAGSNPPAEYVEGVVTKVDAQGGLVTLSIGSDAGLAKGNTLELFRLLKTARKYLGTVRVLSVTPHEAVAQPASRLLAPAQVGDPVASRLLGER
jgi:hypothetical protein